MGMVRRYLRTCWWREGRSSEDALAAASLRICLCVRACVRACVFDGVVGVGCIAVGVAGGYEDWNAAAGC